MRNRNLGFTLVELLVVLSIIGILIALIAPAIGVVRATARRFQCGQHLEQMGIAIHAHNLSKRRLPGYCEQFGEFAGGFDPSNPGNYAGNVPPHAKIGTWQVALLANLDHVPHYEHWTEDRYPLMSDGMGMIKNTWDGYSRIAAANLSIFQCPSASGSIDQFGKNNYIANTGMHVDTYPLRYMRPGQSQRTVDFLQSMNHRNAALNNQFAGLNPADLTQQVPVGKPITLEDFHDGLSHTMLISESNQARPWYQTSLSGSAAHLANFRIINGRMVSTYQPESRYLQGAVWHFEDGMNAAGAPLPKVRHKINGGDIYNESMNRLNCTDLARPSSLHVDGVNVLFADGSVIFVTDSIDYRTYQAMLTPHTKASDMPQNEFVPLESW